MKKHLTSAPATFAEMGVQVPSEIEAVVRHALEKDAVNRPASVETFISELRDAVASASLWLNRTQVGHISIDSATLISPPATPTSPPQSPQTSGPLAGTISSGSLDDYTHQQSAASMEAKRLREQADVLEERARQAAEAQKREQERLEQERREQERREMEERDRIAREELAREEEMHFRHRPKPERKPKKRPHACAPKRKPDARPKRKLHACAPKPKRSNAPTELPASAQRKTHACVLKQRLARRPGGRSETESGGGNQTACG